MTLPKSSSDTKKISAYMDQPVMKLTLDQLERSKRIFRLWAEENDVPDADYELMSRMLFGEEEK